MPSKRAQFYWKPLFPFILEENLKVPICTECLIKRKVIVLNRIKDFETGEIICGECGLVIAECRLEYEKIKRPSPFPPPKE